MYFFIPIFFFPQGFYGEVYKGFIEYPDTSEVQYVAVKKLITDSSTYIADFEREISIMKVNIVG